MQLSWYHQQKMEKKDASIWYKKFHKGLRDLQMESTKKTQTRKTKRENSEKLEILRPKNDKTLEEGIRLPTMEDLYFQKNDKTLKDVPRQHCQATTLRTLKK